MRSRRPRHHRRTVRGGSDKALWAVQGSGAHFGFPLKCGGGGGNLNSQKQMNAEVECIRRSVTVADRFRHQGHPGGIVWLTGLPAAGKSTVAAELERQLFALGKSVYVLDGDIVRRGLCADLGFSPADRAENIRRVAEVAALFADAGIICIAALVSPLRRDRELARKLAREALFVEVFVNAPVEICARRDPKGLYARAQAGEIREFTGVSAPYEPPKNPEIEIRTDQTSVSDEVASIRNYLLKHLAGC